MNQDDYMNHLKLVCNPLEIRFLSPIYLVGSFVEKFRDALDVDLVMVMTENRIKRIFGSMQWNERRFRFCTKQKLFIEDFVSDFDIDFKVQYEAEFKAGIGNKTKLCNEVENPR